MYMVNRMSKGSIVITAKSILIAVLLSSCLEDEPFKKPYEGYVPVVLPDGTQISTPENENMDASLLEDAFQLIYDDNRFVRARSLLVYRKGKLVAEAYPNNSADMENLTNIQSCTKSITSILVGIAEQEGYIDSLGEPLYSIYPEYFDEDVRKRTITIEDALVMQTGLEFDNSKHTLELYQTTSNSVQYVLSQDYIYKSGKVTNYNDGAPQLVSKVIERKTGHKVSDYARKKLFDPLGITKWKWEAAKDGTPYGAFSLYLRPRDFGRIGNLLLNEGKHNNVEIIDSAYLAAATSTKVSANFNHEPYGYYFWILPAFDGYAALGHGGQFLLIVPAKELVVVYTAWPYTSGEFFDQSNNLMDLIWQSCY